MLHKRVDYGFGGYQVPFVPRAARSARRRGPIKKKAEDNQLCSFELLATVAGKILLEGESSDKLSVGNDLSIDQDVVMEDCGDQGDPMLEIEHCDQGNVRAVSPCLTLELGLPGLDLDLKVKEPPVPLQEASSAPSSAITSSDFLGKDNPLTNIDLDDEKSEFCSHTGDLDGLVPGLLDSYSPPVDSYAGHRDGRGEILFGSGLDTDCAEGPEILNGNPPATVSSDSVKLTLGNGHYPCGSLSPCRDNNVNLVSRDDDENSSECTQPSTIKTTKSPARIGDRRIRKLLASMHWRTASKARDGDLSDNEVRCLYRTRRMGYKRQRSQRIYPFKKRKCFRYSSFSHTDGHVGFKGLYRSRDKASGATASGFGSVGHGVNGSSACIAGQSTSFLSKESHVKLRIKSFCVPELFIEMPETATIGSLKRMVMEAVTSLLGGGLNVGVLLQGKRIRDDNRTLSQTGIGQEDQMESLGFTLDPNPATTIAPICSQDNSSALSTDVPQPVSRCPIAAPVFHQGGSHLSTELMETSVGNVIESDHDSAPSPADLSAEKGIVDSQALVVIPEGTSKPLSSVPAYHKVKRCDMGQRRIRRPFSVTEVESLVQAVEKLGTGRWRDVKLRAFDDVKHRTYVDLKDKWKTLVHTAKIAPQQRRGEPVPQVLLDRVLAAHSYWSQQHSKQQFKQPSGTCLL